MQGQRSQRSRAAAKPGDEASTHVLCRCSLSKILHDATRLTRVRCKSVPRLAAQKKIDTADRVILLEARKIDTWTGYLRRYIDTAH